MNDDRHAGGNGEDRSAEVIPLRSPPATDTAKQPADQLQRLALEASTTLTDLVATADRYDVEVPSRIRHAAAALQEPSLDSDTGAPWGAMNRRQLLGNAALVAGALLLRQRVGAVNGLHHIVGDEATERVTHLLKTPGKIDAATVLDMEMITAAYRRSYRQLSVRTLLPQADGQAELVRELLAGSMKPTLRNRLTATAAQATALVGVMLLMDLYAFDAAWLKLSDGLNAAREADAQELEAFILGCMAFNAGYSGRQIEAIDLITQARTLAAKASDPTTKGWLAAVEGELRARSGNVRACLAALDAAERALQGVERDNPSRWIGVGAFDAAKLKGYYGVCYLQLEQPEKAAEELTRALDSLEPALRKHRCTALADLATALIRLGEIDEGCRRASQALTLAIELRHAVSVDRIRELDHHLAPWRDAPTVKAFREQLMEQLLVAFHRSALSANW